MSSVIKVRSRSDSVRVLVCLHVETKRALSERVCMTDGSPLNDRLRYSAEKRQIQYNPQTKEKKYMRGYAVCLAASHCSNVIMTNREVKLTSAFLRLVGVYPCTSRSMIRRPRAPTPKV